MTNALSRGKFQIRKDITSKQRDYVQFLMSHHGYTLEQMYLYRSKHDGSYPMRVYIEVAK